MILSRTTLKEVFLHVALAVFFCALLINPVMAQTRLENPSAFPSLSALIEGLLRSIVYIALPIISLFVVYSGFKFVFAQGNQEAIKEAKYNFLYVIIGALLILGAWALAQLIGNTVNELRT